MQEPSNPKQKFVVVFWMKKHESGCCNVCTCYLHRQALQQSAPSFAQTFKLLILAGVLAGSTLPASLQFTGMALSECTSQTPRFTISSVSTSPWGLGTWKSSGLTNSSSPIWEEPKLSGSLGQGPSPHPPHPTPPQGKNLHPCQWHWHWWRIFPLKEKSFSKKKKPRLLWTPDAPKAAKNWRSAGGVAFADLKSNTALAASSCTSWGLMDPQAHFSNRDSPRYEVVGTWLDSSAASLCLRPPLLLLLGAGSSLESTIRGFKLQVRSGPWIVELPNWEKDKNTYHLLTGLLMLPNMFFFCLQCLQEYRKLPSLCLAVTVSS